MLARASATGDILIVDDDPDFLSLLAKILKGQGYTVTLATTAEQALAAFRLRVPDLVLLDVLLPDMDGYKVCSYMKLLGAGATVPVIFISGLSDTVDKVKGFAVGGADFITKPFAGEEVLARVASHLALNRALREKEEHNTRLEEQIARYRESAPASTGEGDIASRLGASDLLAARVDAYHMEQLAWLREQFVTGGEG
ncbi:MAG: response regulator [Magnetococcales bacterium]|nr:response regulator [Magnetococcales bacterium]